MNKLVVHKITDVVEADWEILGPVAKSPNGDVHIGEVAYKALCEAGAPPSGADMVHLETATNGDKVCILKTSEGVYWVVTYDSAWLTKAVVSEIVEFPEALGALKTTLARLEK